MSGTSIDIFYSSLFFSSSPVDLSRIKYCVPPDRRDCVLTSSHLLAFFRFHRILFLRASYADEVV